MSRAWIMIAVMLFGTAGTGRAESPVTNATAAAVDAAVGRGVAFLLSQQEEDGAFTLQKKNKDRSTALTSLAILALSAVGHQPTDQTREGAVLRKALEFVLREDRQEEDGYFGKRDGSMMYGHGITTLMLAEMLGMSVTAEQDQLIRWRCRKGIELILRSQAVSKEEKFQGGWRYQPGANDADLSVTVWQVMALRAAKNAGLAVPKEAITKATAYLKRSYQSRRDDAGRPTDLQSGCGYQPGNGPSYASGAAGLLAFEVCGESEALEAKGSASWLAAQKLKYDSDFFFYGSYYFSQSLYQRGGETAGKARQAVEAIMLAHQSAEDGSWQAAQGQEKDLGKVYGTTMALLSLSVKYHYLPIYQR